jgi:hypothetical protein
LESTSTNLNYKLNPKESDKNNNNYLSCNTNKKLVDQPFQGLNIFRNFLKRSKANKNSNFLYSEFSLDTNPNLPLEALNTVESNSEIPSPSNLPESPKKSEKIFLHRPSIKNADLKAKLRSKSKIRPEHKLVTVNEIISPLNTSSTPKHTKNCAYKLGNLLRLNIKDEITFNKLYPINFKDCVSNLKKEKEANERLIRLALLGKEKIIKISPNALANLSAVDSLLISEKEKNAISQIAKINFLDQKQEKLYKEKSEFLTEQRIKVIFSDTVYAITDIFFSGDEFNMKRLQPVDFTDLKQKILAAQTNFKLLTSQEKKNYISNLKELKIKHKDDKKQRLLELNIKNSLSGFIEKFSEEEIAMAKKCLLNFWRFPPPDYFDSTFSKIESLGGAAKKADGESSSDELKNSNSMKLMNTSWTKDFYVNMLKGINEEPNNLNISHLNNKTASDEPEVYKNCMELVEKQKGGLWISWAQFLNVFKGFVIVHNPKLYRSMVNIDSNWYNYKRDIYYSEKLVFFLSANGASLSLHTNINSNEAFVAATALGKNAKEDKGIKDSKNVKENNKEKDKDKEKEKDTSHLQGQVTNAAFDNYANANPISAKYNTDLTFSQNLLPNTKFYNNISNSCFLIVFEPNTTQNHLFSDLKYYIIFDLISASGKKIFANIKLTGYFATYQFDEIYFDQEYYLIVTGGVHPFGYNLRIMSDHFVETLNYFNYVKKFYGLNQQTLNVACSAIEKNKIFVLGRVKITNKENGSFLVNVKQTDNNVDNYLRQFYEVFMVCKNQEKRVYLDKLQDLQATEDPIYVIIFLTFFSFIFLFLFKFY